MAISIATSEKDVARCFEVMKQLRTHLATVAESCERVAAQQEQGYQLALVERDGSVVAVAGFRIIDMLFSGKTLYIDDLVTDATRRSQGLGQDLIAWLIEFGRKHGCATLSLDSGLARERAHAFYFRVGMHISCFHFQQSL